MVTIRKHGRGARVDAQLVLERHALHVVARAERSVGVHQIFRHDEKRNAFDALRRVRGSRQYHVNDVFGVIVLAVGDEDLLAVQLVAAVALRHRARAYGSQIGAGLRLGQIHRARPRAIDHLGQERGFLFGRGAQLQRLDRALRQERAKIERHVRRMPHLLDGRRNELRQTLPAVFRILGESIPAVLDELLIRILESRRRLHAAIG